MNQPPYIITDVFTDIVAAVAAKLESPVYSYYGYVDELNESLIQLNGSPTKFDRKFPLVWLAEPFDVVGGKLIHLYGEVELLRMFIMTGTQKTWKAKQRIANNFKPILVPICEELINQVALSKAFIGYRAKLNYKVTNRYYWGEDQQSVLNDVVDIMEVKFYGIKIQNNLNC